MTSADGFPTIRTYSGHTFDYVSPTPEMIDPRDISAALSKLCRFAGQSREFYSVAQHSVLVSCLLEAEHDRRTLLPQWGLLHDAAEAYCVDIPRPLKRLLPEYKAIELRVARVIAERFALPWPMPLAVEDADRKALAIEGISFMSGRDDEYGVSRLPEHLRAQWRLHPLVGNLPASARKEFILRAHQMFGPAYDWGLV